MSNQRKLMVAAIAAILLIMGYFTFAKQTGHLPLPGGGDRVSDLERKQQAQFDALNEKIDRLADAMGNRSSAPDPRAAGLSRATLPPQLRGLAVGTQNESKQREFKAELERQFRSQPVDPRWATESTHQVEQALTADKLQEIGASPPTAQDVDCRSNMCRVHMVYPNAGDASDAAMMLNMEIAKTMPYTRVISEPRPDGGVDYIVYASRQPTSLRR